ncbi:MAG: S-layer homology domain-containing protein, partial [Chloroflexota bacterium]|nr:S-layer homology domain-containing protein [Chloroflexota bacterium]
PPTATATIPPTNIWLARAPYPLPIKDVAVVAQGGLLYSFGGQTTDTITTAAYRYDPAADTWTSLMALPNPQAGLSAVSDGTFIYLLNGDGYSNHLYRYDPATDRYTLLAAAPTGTYRQTAALVNGVIYRIGGQTSSVSNGVSSVEAYTIATNTWTTLADYPNATYLSMSLGANGLVYGAGGAGDADLLKAYRYDPATPGWDDLSVPDLPQSRWGAASGGLGGKWVLAGGNANGALTASALIWDLQPGHTWQPLPPMLRPRQKLGGAAIGFNFFAVGGEGNTGVPTTDVQEYLAPCDLQFSDVQSSDYFYTSVQYLACRGVIGGYSDGTFRPYNQTTRAQLAKIVVGGEGWMLVTPATAHFSDVPAGSTFYSFVETALAHGIISGYNDGTFRPSNPVTRGQLSKIIVGAQGWAVNLTGAPHFSDVATANIFYPAIETAFNHGIISGYNDGTFRPGNPATRGQIAKIVYLALQSGLAADQR